MQINWLFYITDSIMLKYIYIILFIFISFLLALSPNTGAEKTYLPLIHNKIPLSFVPARVVGRLVDIDGNPKAGTIVRLAEIWCTNYDLKYNCVVLLDLANDPGDCTDKNGEYELPIRAWYLENVKGWLFLSGDVINGDYQLHYSSYDDIIEVYSGQIYDMGDVTTYVTSETCNIREQLMLDKIIKVW